jgi:uncharacterized membrane protein YciS (DUF1049 family)
MRPRALIRFTLIVLLVLMIFFAIFWIVGGNDNCIVMDETIRQAQQNLTAFLAVVELITVGIIGAKLSKHAKDGLGIKQELKIVVVMGLGGNHSLLTVRT